MSGSGRVAKDAGLKIPSCSGSRVRISAPAFLTGKYGESSSSGHGRCMKGGNTEAIKPNSGEEPPKPDTTEKGDDR